MTAQIVDEDDIDDLWRRMMKAEYVPGQIYWLEGPGVQRATTNSLAGSKPRSSLESAVSA